MLDCLAHPRSLPQQERGVGIVLARRVTVLQGGHGAVEPDLAARPAEEFRLPVRELQQNPVEAEAHLVGALDVGEVLGSGPVLFDAIQRLPPGRAHLCVEPRPDAGEADLAGVRSAESGNAQIEVPAQIRGIDELVLPPVAEYAIVQEGGREHVGMA